MKLNVGCGFDYREGFINVDGNELIKADKYINIKNVLKHFEPNTIELIVANQILEHFYHWEAIKLLKNFHTLLELNGKCEITVPNCQAIIESNWPIEKKITYLYGGQDKPQPGLHTEEQRKLHPEFFCHKYGWTKDTVEKEWGLIFPDLKVERRAYDLVVTAIKSQPSQSTF